MCVVRNRPFLPPRQAGWRNRLKFARVTAEPDESKIAFEVRSRTIGECLRRIAYAQPACGVVTIVTDVPD